MSLPDAQRIAAAQAFVRRRRADGYTGSLTALIEEFLSALESAGSEDAPND